MKEKLLVILAIVSLTFFATFTYSRYKNVSKGSGTIRGASWSVSMTGNNEDIVLTSGTTEQTYTLTVTNNSEVDVVYSIELSNLPSGMKVKLDSGQYVEEVNNKITFNNAGTMLYGTSPVNHVLTFSSVLDAQEITNKNFNINVVFKQKID
jgi:hypothetical protein